MFESSGGELESGGGVSVNGDRIQGRGIIESGGGGDGSESEGGDSDESDGGEGVDVESVGGGAELSDEESGGEAESAGGAGGEELGEPSESDILLPVYYLKSLLQNIYFVNLLI